MTSPDDQTGDGHSPPPLPGVRDLTDDEYDATYADGSGGHELPAEVLEQLAPEEVDPADG